MNANQQFQVDNRSRGQTGHPDQVPAEGGGDQHQREVTREATGPGGRNNKYLNSFLILDCQVQLPNNQAPVLPARPLPAEAYKNNLLKV